MLPRKEDCTGCGACSAVCPKQAIAMVTDEEGFLYPEINRGICVDCGLCHGVCPEMQGVTTHDTPVAVAAKHKEDAIRRESSSGGVFSALAQEILNRGGVVCAAVYDETFAVVHKIGKEIAPFRGAKYAQSHAGHLFPTLRRLLQEGTEVLFVGTPCQCAGLMGYLGKKPENLVLVDMICHGVPSPKVWQEYLKLHEPVRSVNLRSKVSGWSHYGYSVKIGDYTQTQSHDPFMRGFTANLYLRPSCAKCTFKGLQRCTDITLADFWGIWDLLPDFDDDKGTSLLLIHSSQGHALWKAVQESFDWQTVELCEAVSQNPSAEVSSQPHPKRLEFFSRLGSEPVDTLIWSCIQPPPQKQSLLRRIRNRLFP